MQFSLGGQKGENEGDLADALASFEWSPAHLIRYWWVIVGATLIAAVLGGLRFMQSEPVYRATTTIKHDPSPTRPMGDNMEDVADPLGHYWTLKEFLDTENLVITSVGVARRVVLKLGLYKDPHYGGDPSYTESDVDEIDRIARQLTYSLTIEPVSGTRLVRLHVTDSSAERAQLIANMVASTYVEQTVEERRATTAKASEWLSQQINLLRNELQASELALHEFKKSNNVLSVPMEDRQDLVTRKVSQINDQLSETKNRTIALKARVNRIKKAIDGGPDELDPVLAEEHPGLAKMANKLHEKLIERQNKTAKYGENHPEMVALNQELAWLKTQVSKQKAMILRSARADLQQAKQVEQGLTDAAQGAHDRGLELNLSEIEYRSLQRNRDNTARLYETLLQRRAETELHHLLEVAHASVLDRAGRPGRPMSAGLLQSVGLTALYGAIFGVLLAFVLGNMLPRAVNSLLTLEDFGVEVFGVIPQLRDEQPSELPAVIQEDPVMEMIVHQQPMSAGAESFRMLRNRLSFLSDEVRPRLLLLTSSDPKEGKTTVATNLAVTLAKFGRSVLLVDTDLRRSRIHRVFGLSKKLGVTSVTDGVCTLDKAIRKTSIENLDFLSSGPRPEQPGELLHSAAFDLLLKKVRKQYDWVIFDSPPLQAVTDAAVLGPQLDGVMLVVRAGETKIEAVASSLQQLQGVSANVIGFVVNDADTKLRRGGNAAYYRYYDYGYREPIKDSMYPESGVA